MSTHPPATDLERYRPRLFAVAYRMLGDVHDAEDLVQEAFLRWYRESRADVVEPEAWLVSVTTRLAIDRLRRRATERQAYPGPWLPEPASNERFGPPPDRHVELASDLSMAFLVMLERLAPEERAAFLMREVFDSSYADIAQVLERSEVAARQVVHRARERVRTDRARFSVSPEVIEQLLHRFLDALEADDEEGLMAVFTADATFTSDGGGKVTAARRVVRGATRITRLLRGVETKYGRPFRYRIAVLNGEPALIQYLGERVFSANFIGTDGERITAMYRVMNPDKLGDVQRL
jgi:RNA polymerase sigma-70 factor (ECF subfamily)